MGESQRLPQRGGPRHCGCWAAKGLVSEKPPKVCITGSKGEKWAEGEKGPQGSLGKAWWSRKMHGDVVLWHGVPGRVQRGQASSSRTINSPDIMRTMSPHWKQ